MSLNSASRWASALASVVTAAAVVIGCLAPGTTAAPVRPGVPAERPASTAKAAAPITPRVDCQVQRCVALTFDDGPGPLTGRLLSELSAAHVKATFFVLGSNAERYPSIVRRQVAAGMVVGNHTYSHRQLTSLSVSAQRQEVRRAERAIMAAGAPRPTLMRPPYGSFNAATRTLGAPLVLWNVDSEDWKNRNAAVSTAIVLREVRRGSIILMHDIQPSTVRAVPGLIRALKARGYTLVTVPQLMGTMRPGSAHYGR